MMRKTTHKVCWGLNIKKRKMLLRFGDKTEHLVDKQNATHLASYVHGPKGNSQSESGKDDSEILEAAIRSSWNEKVGDKNDGRV